MRNPTLPEGFVIAPSLLAADPARFGHHAERVERAGAHCLHLDIMDGNFVPNISFGPAVVKALRNRVKMFFDVHLMCTRPEILLDPFKKAGADQITVHVELGDKVGSLLWKVRSLGCKVGLAVNPPTSMQQVEPYLSQIDLLLVMTVNPGFGGQSFIGETLPKVQHAAARRRALGKNFRICVDGGVDAVTARECARAGADMFVCGTSVFRHANLRTAMQRIQKGIEQGASRGASAVSADYEFSF
jgi:ribulose-phosphate 3-epimerase